MFQNVAKLQKSTVKTATQSTLQSFGQQHFPFFPFYLVIVEVLILNNFLSPTQKVQYLILIFLRIELELLNKQLLFYEG